MFSGGFYFGASVWSDTLPVPEGILNSSNAPAVGGTAVPDLLGLAFRIVIMFILSIGSMRLMGKTTITQVTPYDLVAIFIIGAIASEPLISTDFSASLFGLAVLVLTYVFFSRLTLNQAVNTFLLGEPTVVIKHGKIDMAALKKNHLSLMQLLSIMRSNGFPRLEEVEYAIVEPVGTVSIIPKASYRPVTPEDLHLNVSYEGLPISVIIDGKIQRHNLKLAGKDERWVRKILNKNSIPGPENVNLAYLEDSGHFYINTRDERGYGMGISSMVEAPGRNEAGPTIINDAGSEKIIVVRGGRFLPAGLRRSGLDKSEMKELLEKSGLADTSQVEEAAVNIRRNIAVVPRKKAQQGEVGHEKTDKH